jgi:hypothetical protein
MIGCKMSVMDQREILEHLLAEVAQATESHKLAHLEFSAVMNDIPSGLPHPDGVQRLTNASTACAHARQTLRGARSRLEQFETYGFVPRDLK